MASQDPPQHMFPRKLRNALLGMRWKSFLQVVDIDVLLNILQGYSDGNVSLSEAAEQLEKLYDLAWARRNVVSRSDET